MNRTLLFAAAAALLAALTIVLPDGWIYAGTALLGLVIVAVIRLFHPRAIKLTRWAKENPRKTQVLITVLQIFILSLGLLAGYNMKEMGYRISGTPVLIFGTILVAGFFTTRFLPKRNLIALPAALNKDRLAYMSIALSAYVIMIITGNRIEDRYPGSFMSTALRTVDQAIFPGGGAQGAADPALASHVRPGGGIKGDASSSFAFASLRVPAEKIVPPVDSGKEARELKKEQKKAEKLEKKKQKMQKRLEKLRKAFAAVSTVATVLLVILLVITSCAGICLILIGGSAGSVILGIVLTGGSIWGFIELFKKKKTTSTNTG